MANHVPRRVLSELLGTMLLVATVVGSGVMAERLAGGNVAIALLANTVATAAALLALITTLAPVSGAHFNPIVTLVEALDGGVSWRSVPAYLAAQILGAILGAVLAHLMFTLPPISLSLHERAGAAQVLSEAVATFGLLLVIGGVSRHKPAAVPACVAAYIAAAYWFTASTSFANPAVTFARALSDTFAGIRPVDVPGFLAGQLAGAACAFGARRVLWPKSSSEAQEES
jgi:glycerol uptake facilitator-like aquaporin